MVWVHVLMPIAATMLWSGTIAGIAHLSRRPGDPDVKTVDLVYLSSAAFAPSAMTSFGLWVAFQ